ncbi:MAG: hypothetical protein KAS32_13255 [Candidatus Peribacteraceae bacterium]|nr:hypothetical protein [Candidatus Peribacteraceae bacterium]
MGNDTVILLNVGRLNGSLHRFHHLHCSLDCGVNRAVIVLDQPEYGKVVDRELGQDIANAEILEKRRVKMSDTKDDHAWRDATQTWIANLEKRIIDLETTSRKHAEGGK